MLTIVAITAAGLTVARILFQQFRFQKLKTAIIADLARSAIKKSRSWQGAALNKTNYKKEMENEENNQLAAFNEETDKLKAYLEWVKIAANFIEKNPKTTTGIVLGGLGLMVVNELLKKKK